MGLLRKLFLFIATFKTFALATESFAQATPEKSWELHEVVNQALEYQPLYLREKEKLDEASALRRQAYSTILPVVNGVLGWNEQRDALKNPAKKFGGNPYNNYHGGFEATQSLFSGGQFWAARRAANAGEDIQRLEISLSERDLILRTTLLFYQVLLAQRNIEIAERLIKIQEELLKTAESRYRNGRETRLTTLRVRTALALLKPTLSQARNNLSLIGAELVSLSGIRSGSVLKLRGQLGPWQLNPPDLSPSSVRPEITQSRLRVELLDANRSLLLAKHFPQLELFGNVYRNGFKKSDLANGDATESIWGLRLTIPLFSGLESVWERQQLSSQYAQLRLANQDLSNNLDLDKVRAEQGFENARVVADAQMDALKQAREAVQIAARNFRLGTANYTEISDTQEQLANAESAYANAQYQVLENYGKYFKAFNLPIKKLIGDIEKSEMKESL